MTHFCLIARQRLAEWFYIDNAKSQAYAASLLGHDFESVDFDSLERKDFSKIDFLFVYSDKNVFFQNISRARLVAKKSILCLGEDFEYKSNQQEIDNRTDKRAPINVNRTSKV